MLSNNIQHVFYVQKINKNSYKIKYLFYLYYIYTKLYFFAIQIILL